MYNFFFSYSRNANKDIVEYYICILESYGFKLWYDKVDVILGRDINHELDKILSECEHWSGMILFLDDTYFCKEWCLKELDYAINKHIPIYPILLNISKKDIPYKYQKLKEINLCTIHSLEDVDYAVCKTLYLFLNNIEISTENLFDLTQYSTLNRIVTDFINGNQQIEDIIFTCDNIALCLKYLMTDKKIISDENIKIIYNIIHLTTKRYYIEGIITRFQIRIVVKATKLLLKICY